MSSDIAQRKGCEGEGEGWVRTELTYDQHPSGAAVEVRKAAREAFLYAQMAQNTYPSDEPGGKERRYVLPSYVREIMPLQEARGIGFAARVYEVRKPGEQPVVVFAFRGTNFWSCKDWIFGNFPFINTQYKYGHALVKRVKAKSPAGTRFVAVGHSLGGAIATYISLNEEDVTAYGFNASHRVSRGKAVCNDRYFISQTGEIGVLFRRPFINPSGLYTTINCKKGWSLDRHTMTYLADCLTKLAALDNDKEATASVARNNIEAFDPALSQHSRRQRHARERVN